MKNIILKSLPLLFVAFITPVIFIHAYGPIQIEIVPSPGQVFEQQMRDMELRLQQQRQENTQNQILHQQQELQKQLLQQQLNARLPSYNQQLLTCQSGYVRNSSGGCSTYDQACNSTYTNSIFTKFDIDGKRYLCGCKDGYQWNSQQTSCVIKPIIPVKTNIEICNDSYGENSTWSGTRNESGGLVCSCRDNYQWNSQRTGCEIKPIPSTRISEQNTNPVDICDKGYKWNTDTQYCVISSDATNAQKCEYSYGINSIWSGNLDTQNEPICGCINGFEMNGLKGISKMCVRSVNVIQSDVISTTSTPVFTSNSTDKVEMKSKGFWLKIRGWFGF